MPAAPSRSRETWALSLLWLLVSIIYAVTGSHAWKTPDTASAEVGAWAIATTGAPWVDGLQSNTYVLSVDAAEEDLAERRRLVLFSTVNESNGHSVIGRSPGVVAAGVPAYWLAAQIGLGSPADAISPGPGALTGAALAAMSLLLLGLALRGLVNTRLLAGALLVLALATPYWSVLADALWSHGVTTLGIAGMAWALRHERWWLVGAFGGVALWGRLHLALVVAVVGVGMALWRRRPTIALRVGAASLPFFAGVFVWGHWVYGRWDLYAATGGYAQATNAANPADDRANDLLGVLTNQLGYLVSPDAGLLVWTPVLLAIAPSVVRAWSSTPDWTRVLALGGAVYLLTQGFLNVFDGGTGFWGNRLCLETLTCLFPLLVCSFSSATRQERLVALVLASYQAGVIALGAVFELAHRRGKSWHEYEPLLALRDNAVATVTVVLLGMATTFVVARIVGGAPGPERIS